MVQGTPGALHADRGAIYDRPPGTPFIESSEAYKRKTRPLLRWRPGIDLWGAQRFRVLHGRRADRRDDQRHADAARRRSPPGKHTWQIESVDRAGQTNRSRARTLKIDSIAPTLKVTVSGKRAAGRALKITVTAKDAGGAGLDHITVDYGDQLADVADARRPATATSAGRSPEDRGGRQGGQRARASRRSCGSRSRDPAGGRAAAQARLRARC